MRNSLVLCALGILSALVGTGPVHAQTMTRQDRNPASPIRQDISLDKNWYTIAVETDSNAFPGFEASGYKTKNWRRVDVPHNWDAYGGYRRLRHGNLHGCAWYHRTFRVDHIEKEKKYFLWFEGVGSYATVWVNGIEVGSHAGGRTSFTLDITATLLPGDNLLTVRADHPANIRDLPWVCGACSDDRGFSEGSQPMGIFRPVHLIVTHSTRVEPFGVHIWNDTSVSEQQAALFLETEIKNYGSQIKDLSVKNRLIDKNGLSVVVSLSNQTLPAGETRVVRQDLPVIRHPHLWSIESPYLYTLVTELWVQGRLIDKVSTPYGIRRIHWSVVSEGFAAGDVHPFLLNGHPVFINGIAEYEHRLGQSHAFSAAAIRARVSQIRAAGFNAFRDAHQPHNLRYQEYWDREGLLWWPQLSAHIWYDSPEFRKNFKALLTDWVKERRNSPSLVLWGLQNESKLPADFAKECSDLIRQLDPTASSQRLITTCNGGSGTDWDVPQNWTGTYGGDPATYAEDLRKQILVGEYGAWRTLDLHAAAPDKGAAAQPGEAAANSPAGVKAGNDEDRMTRLMETKIRLAETVKDQVAGHFFWLFSSHDNPGRVQSGEGWRELDRIGPVNYKGLLTSWEEPLDVYYMARSNFVSPLTSPMVYIVSHTWPDRWTTGGKKNGIVVYSNCEEVELFNDVGGLSLGKRKKNGIGTHFQWDSVDIQYNVLYAVGTVKGKVVAKDCIMLHHLPRAPHLDRLSGEPTRGALGSGASSRGTFAPGRPSITAPQPGYHYLYRVNCGGPDYKDVQGNVWMADRHLSDGPAPADGTQASTRLAASGRRTASPTWGSRSWTDDYPGLPPYFASQRRTADPIAGTADAPLFQDFRYGLDKLTYTFPVQDGDYLLELYFVEPWLGTGGGMDCTGWRLFDVAVNDKIVLRDLDIWKAAGHDRAFKKTVRVKITGGQLVLSFPHIASGQAILSALAIATRKDGLTPAPPSRGLIGDLQVKDPVRAKEWSCQSWLDTGTPQYTGSPICFSSLPPKLYGAEWIRGPEDDADVTDVLVQRNATPIAARSGEQKEATGEPLASFRVSQESDVFIALDARLVKKPEWMKDYENTNTSLDNDRIFGHTFQIYRRRYQAGATVWLGGNGQIGEMGPDGNGQLERTEPGSRAPAMYTVIVCPATTLEPAYDSKPVTTYKTTNARVAGDTVEWNIAVGVADTYSLTVKYRYLSPAAGAGMLEIRMENGTLIKKEPVTFSTTPATKWNTINSSTGTMINAGNYKVRLIAPRSENFRVDEIQVQ